MPNKTLTLSWAVEDSDPETQPVVVNYSPREGGGLKIYGVYLLADDSRQRLGLDILPYMSDGMIYAIGDELMAQPS